MNASDGRVRLFDAAAVYEEQAAELLSSTQRVLESGRYILGPEVRAFEKEVAERLGVRHALACASGTDALWLALRALGIGPGDGVIVPDFTFFATASAVLNCGATPVFCDVEPETLTIDPSALHHILEGTSDAHRRVGVDPATIKALLPVHLFGQPADMARIGTMAEERSLLVVEDAAQAFGASFDGISVGAMGDAGCFSFFPTKNLGGFGDGGMVTTNETDVAERLALIRAHGSPRKYTHDLVGTNSRLDALQAALLRVRLGSLDEALATRRALAAAYDDGFRGSRVRIPTRAGDRIHTFNLYVVRIAEDRDDVAHGLDEAGVETAIHYPAPLHLQSAVRRLGYVEGDFAVAEDTCREVLTLPLHPALDEGTVRRVTELVADLSEDAR